MEIPNLDLSRSTIATVSRAWRALASDHTPGHGSCVVPRGTHAAIAPDGWIGIVSIGGNVIVSSPLHLMESIERRLRGHLDASLTDLETLSTVLGPAQDVRGPAVLLYADHLLPQTSPHAAIKAVDHAALATLIGACDPAEVNEAGIESPDGLVGGYIDGELAAVAGVKKWAGTQLGHIGILTAPRFRRLGAGAAVGHAAATDAINAGLVPQWRAAVDNAASIATGLRLGFIETGRQLSVKLASD